jgi:hypothetical protein
MLAEVQKHAAAGYLAIERELLAETMLPIQREPEETAVEFLGLINVEDAEDRDRRLDLDRRWRCFCLVELR